MNDVIKEEESSFRYRLGDKNISWEEILNDKNNIQSMMEFLRKNGI